MELIKAAGMPYWTKQSTYTLEICCENFIHIQFMQNLMSIRAFIANQMIKKDIKLNSLVPPEINF